MKHANPNCEYCHGTGEVTVDVYDHDSHRMQPTGSQECECVERDDEYDPDAPNSGGTQPVRPRYPVPTPYGNMGSIINQH